VTIVSVGELIEIFRLGGIQTLLSFTEPFPSWLCFAELQYVGGLGELTGAPGGKVPARPKPGLAAAELS
jgi:hypothetical protein